KRKSLNKRKKWFDKNFGGCEICGFDFLPVIQIHHIKPIKDGGSDNLTNLSFLCPTCHSMVHSMATKKIEEDYGSDYVDSYLNQNFNVIQKDKLFHFVCNLLGFEGVEDARSKNNTN